MQLRTFTLKEANELLPQLKDDLLKLQQFIQEIEDQSLELEKNKVKHEQLSAAVVGGEDPFFEDEGRLDFLRMEAELLIHNFSLKGVFLKMINPGLIDFPAVLNGQNVLICWRQGEESASHYHSWEEGFIGRKPFPGSMLE